MYFSAYRVCGVPTTFGAPGGFTTAAVVVAVLWCGTGFVAVVWAAAAVESARSVKASFIGMSILRNPISAVSPKVASPLRGRVAAGRQQAQNRAAPVARGDLGPARSE